jgi:CRP-like cAMP-binding protein
LGYGEVLYEPGATIESVYFPSTSVVSVVIAMSDGRECETNTIGFESAVGVLAALADRPARGRTFAQSPGGAMRLATADLRHCVAESPKLLNLLLRHTYADLAQAELSTACNALHGAVPRLARWLLMTSDRMGSPVISLTQDEMSVMLGVQRTTVSGAASVLRAERAIAYSRGRLRVLDRPRLTAMACECYAVGLSDFAALDPA